MAESILIVTKNWHLKVLALPLVGEFSPYHQYPNLEGIRRRLRRAFIRLVRIEISSNADILRKEVIQPQVPLRLPCYDFTPVVNNSLGACFPKVSSATSALVGSHGVTGGVYKARERIHRGVLIRDY